MMIDTALDVATAARRYLAAKDPLNPTVFLRSDLTSLLGSSLTYDTWIFRWKLWEHPRSTGKAAIVLSPRPGLAANQHNTMRFPRLQVEIFVDPPRNNKGDPTSSSHAEDVAWRIALVLDKYLHVTNPDDPTTSEPILWGDESSGALRILRSTRGTDVDISEVPGNDGMVRALVSYEVSLG